MNEMKKILDEHKLTAYDVLLMIARRARYDSINLLKRQIINSYFCPYDLMFVSKNKYSSFVQYENCTNISIFAPNDIKIKTYENARQCKYFEFFLAKMFDAANEGFSIVINFMVFPKIIVLNPYETLESFLMNYDLENPILKNT